MISRASIVVCLSLLAFGLHQACGAGPVLRDGIAAIVNDTVITFRQIERVAEQQLEFLDRLDDRAEVRQQKKVLARQESLELLIERQLILDDFKTREEYKGLGGKLPDSMIEDAIQRRIRERFGDRTRLIQTLKGSGKTYESFRQDLHDEIVMSIMRERQVSSAILISPQKIERFYTNKLEDFKVGDQLKLRMIVLSRPASESVEEVRKMAQEIRAKIEDGVSFAEMASLYSEGSQRAQGGDWGWLELSKLSQGFADVASALATGQVSRVIAFAREDDEKYWTYQYGKTGIETARQYSEKGQLLKETKSEPDKPLEASLPPPSEFRLMWLEAKRPARVKPLTEVKEEIEAELHRQERERLRKKWIDRLKAKSFVRYF
jgi:peptidyl-prolyl cis-trans isomerase SurA